MAERDDRTDVIELHPADAPEPEQHAGATLYRRGDDPQADAVRQERERLEAERRARRDTRVAALNPQPEPVVEPQATTAPAAPVAAVVPATSAVRTTDRFLPSLGLFLLRVALAAIVGVHGLDKLLNPQRATEVFATTVLPQPQLLALGVGVVEVAVAIALVFGLMTRVAGLATAVVAGGTLAFVLWGPWSPFVAGRVGFVGELEVLLAAAGLLLLTTGGGGWALDRGFRTRRTADRAELA